MKMNSPDRSLPVPSLGLDPIATIIMAAVHARHPLGLSTAVAILAPTIADRVIAAPIDRFDLANGTVDIPIGPNDWGRVALGPVAWRAIAMVIGNRVSGHLLEDGCGAPLVLDRDAREYAAELIRESDPNCHAFEWTVDDVRRSAVLHIVRDFPDRELLSLAMTGPRVGDTFPGKSRIAQREVSKWWEDRLCRTVGRLAGRHPLLDDRSLGMTLLLERSLWNPFT